MSDEIKEYIENKISAESLKEIKTLENALGEIRIGKIENYFDEIKKRVLELKKLDSWEIKQELFRINKSAKNQPAKKQWDLPHRIEFNVNNKYLLSISVSTEDYKWSGIWTSIWPLDKSNTDLHKSLINYFRKKPEITKIDEEKGYIHFNLEEINFYFDYEWKNKNYLDQKIRNAVKIIISVIDALKEFENME